MQHAEVGPLCVSRRELCVAEIGDPAATAAAEQIHHLGALLRARPGLSSQEIADCLGFSRRNASLLLLRLEERGHVRHEARRWYPAPDLA